MTSVKHASEDQAAEYVARSDAIKASVESVSKDLKDVRTETQNIALTVMNAKNVGI